MIQLQSYIYDTWQSGEGALRDLLNPSTGETIAQTTTDGLDFAKAIVKYFSLTFFNGIIFQFFGNRFFK